MLRPRGRKAPDELIDDELAEEAAKAACSAADIGEPPSLN